MQGVLRRCAERRPCSTSVAQLLAGQPDSSGDLHTCLPSCVPVVCGSSQILAFLLRPCRHLTPLLCTNIRESTVSNGRNSTTLVLPVESSGARARTIVAPVFTSSRACAQSINSDPTPPVSSSSTASIPSRCQMSCTLWTTSTWTTSTWLPTRSGGAWTATRAQASVSFGSVYEGAQLIIHWGPGAGPRGQHRAGRQGYRLRLTLIQAKAEARSRRDDSGDEVTVLVAYTQAACCYAAGEDRYCQEPARTTCHSSMDALISLAVAETNQA